MTNINTLDSDCLSIIFDHLGEPYGYMLSLAFSRARSTCRIWGMRKFARTYSRDGYLSCTRFILDSAAGNISREEALAAMLRFDTIHLVRNQISLGAIPNDEMHSIIVNGGPKCFDIFCKSAPADMLFKFIKTAGHHGKTYYFRHICRKYPDRFTPRTIHLCLVAIIRGGNIKCLDLFLTFNKSCRGSVCEVAAANGNLQILMYGIHHNMTFNEIKCFRGAVNNNHLECVRYICENTPITSNSHLVPLSHQYLRGPHYWECFQYLKPLGFDCHDQEILCSAINRNDTTTVSHFINAGHTWGTISCEIAISNYKMFVHLHQLGCPWSDKTTLSAAMYGAFESLQYAHQNGCPLHVDSCTAAILADSLPCLQYAHENGLHWDFTMFGGRLNAPNCGPYILTYSD